jgi:hypothetical protein
MFFLCSCIARSEPVEGAVYEKGSDQKGEGPAWACRVERVHVLSIDKKTNKQEQKKTNNIPSSA